MQSILSNTQTLVVDDRMKGLVPFLPLNIPSGNTPSGNTPARPGLNQSSNQGLNQPGTQAPATGAVR
jgi:hypothetical protein